MTELDKLITEAITSVVKDSAPIPGRFVKQEDDVYSSFKSKSEKPDNEAKVKSFQQKVSKLKEALEYLDEDELNSIAEAIANMIETDQPGEDTDSDDAYLFMTSDEVTEEALDEDAAQSFRSLVNKAVKAHNEGKPELAKKHTTEAFYAAARSKGADEYKLHGTPYYKTFQELRKIYK